jgi:broad-specificity NMP kinase
MEKIILIRGPLGIGKSTVSKMVAEKMNALYVSVDKVLDDNNLAPGGGIPVENFLKANEIILKQAENSKIAVVDGNFYYQDQIDDLEEQLKDNLIVVSLTCSVEKCINRNSGREKVYSEDAARFVYAVTEKIRAGHYINTENQTPEETVDEVVTYIKYPLLINQENQELKSVNLDSGAKN